jgi:hypothetical protein
LAFRAIAPLGTPKDVDEVIGFVEVQCGGNVRVCMTCNGNKFELTGGPVLHHHPLGENEEASGRVKHVGQPRGRGVEREKFWEIGYISGPVIVMRAP